MLNNGWWWLMSVFQILWCWNMYLHLSDMYFLQMVVNVFHTWSRWEWKVQIHLDLQTLGFLMISVMKMDVEGGINGSWTQKGAACWYRDSGKTSSMTSTRTREAGKLGRSEWVTTLESLKITRLRGHHGPWMAMVCQPPDRPVTHLGTRPKMESGSMPCCCWTPEK